MHVRNIHLFKGKKANVLSALTFNDAVYWGADTFVIVVFALFVTQNIDGGTATQVGMIWAFYAILRATLSIPLGQFFDNHKGRLDEVLALAASGLLVGFIYILLFFASELWHIYLGMFFVAIGHSLNVGSWRILFYGTLDKKNQGKIVGVYETVMQIVYALATALAGFVGDTYGFEWVMVVAGVVTILSSAFPLMVKSSIVKS